MATFNYNIDKLITIDNTGMPKAPNVRQLQDKDLLTIYLRDMTRDKINYLRDCGVIYYLGDPKSPPRQQGLSDREALKMAIDNFDLPKDYEPDDVVKRLIEKYYKANITEAGIALEALQKSVHLVSIAATKINEYLNNKLNEPLSDEGIPQILSMIDTVNKKVIEIPNLTKAIATAYENLRNEEEESYARGGKQILSSMDADEDY